MNDIVAEIFKGMDQTIISEDVKAKVAAMIDQIVEARTAAKTQEISDRATKIAEDNSRLKMEVESMMSDILAKEQYLQEAAREWGSQMAAEFKQKESILFETLKEYQEESIKVLTETATDYRNAIEATALETGAELRSFMEQEVLEAAAQFKKTHEATRAKELTEFKEDLLEKADAYIVAELQKNIPESILEAATEAAALKPLVEGVIAVIEKNGVKIDKSGFEALNAAKVSNTKLSEALNVKVTENVKLEARVKALEKKVKLSQLTEGMTLNQKAKATKLLESSSVENLELNFKAIKDMIVEESTKSPVKVSQNEVKPTVATDATKKQVQRIVESINKPAAGKTDDMTVWAANLDRMRRN